MPLRWVDLDAAPNLSAGADIGGVRRQRVEGDPADIGVGVRIFVHIPRRIANGGSRHADPAVEPGATTEAAEDGIETASTTAGPTTGPEFVKFSATAPAASRRLASSTNSSSISSGTWAALAAEYAMPYLSAVCGVIPNCAKTGIAGAGHRLDGFGKIGGAVELD